MSYTFEMAKREDAEEVLALYKSVLKSEGCVWTETYPSEEELEFDLKRDALFVMRDDTNKIIGAISIDEDPLVQKLECWSKTLEPSGELARLCVDINLQNRGIARELLKNGMKVLKERGYKGIHFLVCKSNMKAVNSYSRLNFNNVGDCYMFENDYWCYEKEL